MNKNKTAVIVIVTLSIVVPALVAILLFSPYKITAEYAWVKNLPTVNAIINTLTAVLLLAGRYFAQQQDIKWHRAIMSSALALGTLFLLSYVVYHASSESAVYGDTNLNGILEVGEKESIGILRPLYLITLLGHIGLSVVVVPLVLSAFYFALAGKIDRHLKVVKYTWPVWMIVSVSGVIVYFMVSPYYPV